MKFNKMLFCRAAIAPLAVTILWAEKYFRFSHSRITLLLTLLIVLAIDHFIIYIRAKLKYEGTNERLQNAADSSFCFLGICTKLWILAILMALAVSWHVYILLLLLALIPVETLSYLKMYQELTRRSSEVQKNWQDKLPPPGETGDNHPSGRHNLAWSIKILYRSTLGITKYVSVGGKVLHMVNVLARAELIALAVNDFLILDMQPLSLVLFFFLTPLFFSTVNELFHGNLSKQDLINSIYYLKGLERLSGEDYKAI